MTTSQKNQTVSSEIESAVRKAISEIQRSGMLCVPPSLAGGQLEGAVGIVVRHLTQACPDLMIRGD